MTGQEIIEECRKRLRPLKKYIVITPTRENWFYKMWLEARDNEEASERFRKEYECEWPDIDVKTGR